jgi:hypothetical protein
MPISMGVHLLICGVLHCVTDNSECCNNGQGDWYDEMGRQVQQGSDGKGGLYVTRGDGVVYLNRRMQEVQECGNVIYLIVMV